MQNSPTPCIVLTYPLPIGLRGGGARHVREVARHLGKNGADVIILSVSATGRTRYPRPEVEERHLGFQFDKELAQNSVSIIRVTQHPIHWRFDGLQVKEAIRKMLQERKVDLVLSFFHEATFLPSLLASYNVKHGYIAAASFSHALSFHSGKNAIIATLRNFLIRRQVFEPLKKADLIFANSNFTRSEVSELIGVDKKKITTCYLGVDPAFSQIARTEPTKITNFIFFGNYSPLNGIEDAMQALQLLSDRGYENWRFRLMGQGERDWVQSLAKQYGITDKVHIMGAVDDKQLRDELKEAHLAILPSHAESFGLAIAEAQAAGLPVISYEVGAVPEVVENGVTGWLAPLGDVTQLSDFLEKAVRSPKQTYGMGLAGRERVQRLFSWDKSAQTILNAIATRVKHPQPSAK